MTSPPSTLPRAKLAQVPAAKLRDYVLNATHPQGGPKARVFAAALGITGLDWQYLREQLLTGVQAAPARHVRSTTWGELYEVVIDVTGRNGQVPAVRTGWIIRTDDPRPQLVTAYVDLP